MEVAAQHGDVAVFGINGAESHISSLNGDIAVQRNVTHHPKRIACIKSGVAIGKCHPFTFTENGKVAVKCQGTNIYPNATIGFCLGHVVAACDGEVRQF